MKARGLVCVIYANTVDSKLIRLLSLQLLPFGKITWILHFNLGHNIRDAIVEAKI